MTREWKLNLKRAIPFVLPLTFFAHFCHAGAQPSEPDSCGGIVSSPAMTKKESISVEAEFSRNPIDSRRGLVTSYDRVLMNADNLIAAYLRGLFMSIGGWYSLPDHSVMDFTGPLKFQPNNDDPAFIRNAWKKGFSTTHNTAFEDVVREAAYMRRKDQGNWITYEHQKLYLELYKRGFAHSFEVRRDGKLVAGLFGILVGNVFRIESMFHLVDDAGKLAANACIQWQIDQGLTFMDTMEGTSTLLNGWGAYSISRAEFLRRIYRAKADKVTRMHEF